MLVTKQARRKLARQESRQRQRADRQKEAPKKVKLRQTNAVYCRTYREKARLKRTLSPEQDHTTPLGRSSRCRIQKAAEAVEALTGSEQRNFFQRPGIRDIVPQEASPLHQLATQFLDAAKVSLRCKLFSSTKTRCFRPPKRTLSH